MWCLTSLAVERHSKYMSVSEQFGPWLRVLEKQLGPQSGEEFSVLGAMTIGMAARNAVEDLHAAGAFSDKQAPALNRRLRNRAYEVLLAIAALADTGHDDRLAEFLAEQATRDGDTAETVSPASAMRGAIRAAVRDFARAEQLDAGTAKKLEDAAVHGATNAFKALRSLNKLESAQGSATWRASSLPTGSFPKSHQS
jgi:hypothetical protein